MKVEESKEQITGKSAETDIETTNSFQQNVTSQIMLKLLATQQSQPKTMDKMALLKSIKTLIMNQRQQNRCQQSTAIPYGSVSTPEQVGSNDMNESKKASSINQDQKKSFNQLSTQVGGETNCEMTDMSKKDQVSPFQGNEKELPAQVLSIGREKEQLTPRKPKVDINGYSNQQVLNYLLQKIDRKDKECEPASEEQDGLVKNKAAVGAVVAPPAKSASLIPELTDKNHKKGNDMCQSEPPRMEASASPN